MTDYFALLNQPPQPWLDAEQLKQAYHAQTLSTHPDAQRSIPETASAETAFALLNEAYQTLQEPKRRILHLLALRGHAPAARFEEVPNDIAELFPAIAATTQEVERVTASMAQASSVLRRSLLMPELLALRARVADLLLDLERLQAMADAELQRLSKSPEANDQTVALQALAVRYSYLQRWTTQLAEHQVRLNGA
ncbi:MAG: DnaJ domain-containing protein [Chthoniobacterales bacterium]